MGLNIRSHIMTSETLVRYVSGFSGSINARGPYRPGAWVSRERGYLVARTVDQALWDCGVWPARLYQVEIRPGEVLGSTANLTRVRSFRVAREVPIARALGPHGEAVIALLEELPRIGWLAARARLDEGRVRELAGAHQAALGQAVLPVRFVTSFAAALEADVDVDLRGDAGQSAAHLGAREDSAGAGGERHFANRFAGRAAGHAAHVSAWNAGWAAASAAHLAATLRVSNPADAHGASRLADKLRSLLSAARDRCRQEAWKAMEDLVDAAEETGVDPAGARGELPRIQALVGSVRPEIFPVWHGAWNFTNAALHAASWRARYLVAAPDRPDPFGPLVELYRLGLWPVGPARGSFVVLAPPAAS